MLPILPWVHGTIFYTAAMVSPNFWLVGFSNASDFFSWEVAMNDAEESEEEEEKGSNLIKADRRSTWLIWSFQFWWRHLDWQVKGKMVKSQGKAKAKKAWDFRVDRRTFVERKGWADLDMVLENSKIYPIILAKSEVKTTTHSTMTWILSPSVFSRLGPKQAKAKA